jgi:hypothetical protein
VKFLKSKWYLHKITGPRTGIIRDKPLNTKRDGKLILRGYKYAYQGWQVGRGDRLEKDITWEVIA